MRTLIKRGSDDTISEGDWIDPRGLGTQLFNAASPNQVFYNTKVEEKTTGPSAMARLGNPVAHLSGWCRCGSG